MPCNRTWSQGDFNGDRKVDGLDFLIWQANYPFWGGLDLVEGEDSLDSLTCPPVDAIDLDGDGKISIEEAAKAFEPLRTTE